MPRHSYGPSSEQIRNSRGPCLNNPNSKYHTTYINHFSHSKTPNPVIKTPNKTLQNNRPTGYSANFRPCIYYTPNLDDLDNPRMKLKVNEHYLTVSEKDFKALTSSPSGKEIDLKQDDIQDYNYGSGFTTNAGGASYLQPSFQEKLRFKW